VKGQTSELLIAPEAGLLSIHFNDPRGFHNRGLLLACRKPLGAVSVNVDTRKSFAVMIEHGHLPMLVLPSLISIHPARLLRSFFLHVEWASACKTIATLPSARK
jgi:hypothetical protein